MPTSPSPATSATCRADDHPHHPPQPAMPRGDSRHTSTPATATPATHTVSDRNPSPDQQNATPGTPDTPGADTTENGYYAVWTCLRASDVGAAHRRERVFILAYQPEAIDLLATTYTRSQRRARRPGSRDTESWRPSGGPVRPGTCPVPAGVVSDEDGTPSADNSAWSQYSEAIHKWEVATGRPAPRATEPGTRGSRRASVSG